jgi:hypothetical protein
MARRPNEIQPDSVAPAVRGAFEARLEEAGEGHSPITVHARHECTKSRFDPKRNA